jgi:hypothetical protein
MMKSDSMKRYPFLFPTIDRFKMLILLSAASWFQDILSISNAARDLATSYFKLPRVPNMIKPQELAAVPL